MTAPIAPADLAAAVPTYPDIKRAFAIARRACAVLSQAPDKLAPDLALAGRFAAEAAYYVALAGLLREAEARLRAARALSPAATHST